MTFDGHIESEGQAVEPVSLFEQQLIERIGERPVNLVLVETLSKASKPMQAKFPRPVVDGVVQGPTTSDNDAK
ncbi:MAG: hypothetical protein GVY36_00005 [Verrucomicrobia bacterium]|nr:hypothetical protein [Verrucomicrobiota bacterium]